MATIFVAAVFGVAVFGAAVFGAAVFGAAGLSGEVFGEVLAEEVFARCVVGDAVWDEAADFGADALPAGAVFEACAITLPVGGAFALAA